MKRLLLSTAIALSTLSVAHADPLKSGDSTVCFWGNQATLIARDASGRTGYDAVTIKRKLDAPFYIASGRPDNDAIMRGQPFTVLFPHGDELPATCLPVDAAINALFAANDMVQAAVAHDVCENDSMIDTEEANSRLSADSQAIYADIRSKLSVAYAATSGTDSALDEVQEAFCDAVSER